jgi:PleD family two-component response regulator
VILLAPAETPEAVAAALELGAEDLMAKPCVPALLALRAAHAVERLRLTPAAPRQG